MVDWLAKKNKTKKREETCRLNGTNYCNTNNMRKMVGDDPNPLFYLLKTQVKMTFFLGKC